MDFSFKVRSNAGGKKGGFAQFFQGYFLNQLNDLAIRFGIGKLCPTHNNYDISL